VTRALRENSDPAGSMAAAYHHTACRKLTGRSPRVAEARAWEDTHIMRIAVAAFLLSLLASLSGPVHADESWVGKYRGNFTAVTMHGQVPVGIDLDIEYAENGIVRATMTEYGHRAEAGAPCNGKYLMRGSLEGNRAKLGTKTGGNGGTCARSFELVKEGDSLNGTTGRGQRVELHKQ